MAKTEAKTIKIKSSEARVHTIGYGYAATTGGTGRKSLEFRLLPGINEVLSEAWDAAKKLPVVQHYIRTGAFQELELDRSGLRHLTVDAAITQVGQTFDRDLLKQWKGSETREPVISAIELQIDEVTYKPERDAAKSDAQKDVEAEGFDLQPRAAAQGMTPAELANQVSNVDPQAQRPDEAPAPTPPARSHHAKHEGKGHGSHAKGKGK